MKCAEKRLTQYKHAEGENTNKNAINASIITVHYTCYYLIEYFSIDIQLWAAG